MQASGSAAGGPACWRSGIDSPGAIKIIKKLIFVN
jgi:hypothetical protein